MMLGIGLRWWDMINVLGLRGVLVTMVYFQAIYQTIDKVHIFPKTALLI